MAEIHLEAGGGSLAGIPAMGESGLWENSLAQPGKELQMP